MDRYGLICRSFYENPDVTQRELASILNLSLGTVNKLLGDCLEEAQQLAEKIRQIAPPKELILSMHEPLTGAHVGPGMLAVFFFGNGR